MAGQAVIASRWENKVTFLDLRPLAQFVRNVYFGADDTKEPPQQRRTCGHSPSRMHRRQSPSW